MATAMPVSSNGVRRTSISSREVRLVNGVSSISRKTSSGLAPEAAISSDAIRNVMTMASSGSSNRSHHGAGPRSQRGRRCLSDRPPLAPGPGLDMRGHRAFAGHQEPDALHVDVLGPDVADQAAAVHDQHAVAEAQHLVEVFGDQQYGGVAVALLEEPF